MSRPSRSNRTSSHRILCAIAALGLFVAAACSTDTEGIIADNAETGGEAGGGSVPATRSDGTPADPADQTTTQPGATAPSDTAAPPQTSATTQTTAGQARAEVPPLGGPGSYAGLFLRPEPRGSSALLLDVYQADGATPQGGTLSHLRDTLSAVSNKTVDLRQTGIDAPTKSWTAGELRALGDANGGSSTLERGVIEIFFLHGDYADDDSVLGVAVRSDVAAVFVDKIDQATGLLDSPAALEKAVTTHEVGHLLGLVDLFLDTGRDDPEHPKHSTNPDSAMYWAIESVQVSQLIEGTPPSDFDAADLADLATIRNG